MKFQTLLIVDPESELGRETSVTQASSFTRIIYYLHTEYNTINIRKIDVYSYIIE